MSYKARAFLRKDGVLVRENTAGVFSRERKTTQNKRERYNKNYSLGWGGVTRRGMSRRVFGRFSRRFACKARD